MLAISRISMILRQNGEKLRFFLRIRRKVEKRDRKKKVTGSQITILYVIRIDDKIDKQIKTNIMKKE